MTAGIAWSDPSSEIVSDASVPAATESDLSSEVDLESCVGMFSVGILHTFHASATAAGVLRIYGKVDGTNYGTDPIYTATLTLLSKGSAARQGPIPFPIPCRYIKVAVYNSDASQVIVDLKLYLHKNYLSLS